jgi:hypothetical protein
MEDNAKFFNIIVFGASFEFEMKAKFIFNYMGIEGTMVLVRTQLYSESNLAHSYKSS